MQGATETKRILMQPGGRSVEWITRDAAGRVTARRNDPADNYDARTRSWFTGARAADDVFWSNVYVFFSQRVPGVTAAVHGPGADPDVVGVDIELGAISRFLGALRIGRTGRAYIVTKSGEMIAGPDPSHILRSQDGQLSPARVNDVGDTDLSGSWDHFRIEGLGSRIINVGDRRLISIVTPIRNGQDWLLVISVPEAEFSGFVTVNSRRAALLSLIVVALAAGLAVLLVRQGLRADRADRAVAERSEAVRLQSTAFARLATQATQFAGTGAPPPDLTETLAEVTGARRAGIWRLVGGDRVLRCEDSFEPATGGHVAGVELSREEVPDLIETLMRGEEIEAPEAARDRRTAAFHSLLMAPLGSASLFAVPIVQDSGEVRRPLGLVLLEDARLDVAERDIARACATLVSLRSTADPLLPDPSTATPASPSTDAEPVDDLGLDTALAPLAPDSPAGAQQSWAPVLVLRLPEAAMARAEAAADGQTTPLAHRIACAAQDIAARYAIPYVKMLGASIVAAVVQARPGEGRGSAADATARLAEAAIALRAMCAELLESSDDPAGFGIGMDAGAVLGGRLGAAPGSPAGLFNLWGEPFRAADVLAGSAPSGAIQASEQAYALLRQSFLFRPRGLFHRPGIGDTRCYVLAGRA